MTESTRAKAGRRPRRSASQLFIAALVVFGIAASVLLLFSDNIQWLRVGLVSALWAAIIGAFAMTKYRREATADQTRAKDLQTVYELQLAREISARREYELTVETRVRSEVQLDTSEVAALRAELTQLRHNLQMLFDGNLPTERVALRAEAIRMQEIGGRNYDGYQPAASGLYVPGRGGSDQNGGRQGGTRESGAGQGGERPTDMVPGLGTPYDEPVTAETSVLYPEAPAGSEAADHTSGAASEYAGGAAAGHPGGDVAGYAGNDVAEDSAGSGTAGGYSQVDTSGGYSSARPSGGSPSRPVPASYPNSDQSQRFGRSSDTEDAYGVQRPRDADRSEGRRIPTPPRASGPTARPSSVADSTAAEPDYARTAAEPVAEPPAPSDASTSEPWAPEPSAPELSAPELSTPDPVANEAVADEAEFASPDTASAFAEAEVEAESTDGGDGTAATPWASESDAQDPAAGGSAARDAAGPDSVAPDSAGIDSPAQAAAPESPRRRRRAAPEASDSTGAHSNGRSVAEIMAGLQTGDSNPSERRRRRRAD